MCWAKQRKISSQANKLHSDNSRMRRKKKKRRNKNAHTALHFIYKSTDNHTKLGSFCIHEWFGLVRFVFITFISFWLFAHCTWIPPSVWRSKLAHMTGYMFSFDLHIQYNRIHEWNMEYCLFNMLKWVWHCFSFHFHFHFHFSLANYVRMQHWLESLAKSFSTQMYARSILRVNPLFVRLAM